MCRYGIKRKRKARSSVFKMVFLVHYLQNKKSLKMEYIIIFAIAFAIEIFFSPRIDLTREKRVLLWYGMYKRHYIVLY
jgi:hypothetical protein